MSPLKTAFSFLGRDIDSIHHAAYILAGATFLGQILGLFRDRLLANLFGAGTTLDVYYAAFRVQDTIFIIIGSLLSLSVLVPLLGETLLRSREEARRTIDNLFSVAFFVAAIVAGVAAIAAPALAQTFFPGIPIEARPTLVGLMRLLLLSPFFFFLSGILGSILQVHSRFYITSLTPLLYNLGIIIGITFFYPIYGIYGIGAGVILGAALNAFSQLPYVGSLGLLPRFTFNIDWKLIQGTTVLAIKRAISLGTQYLVLFFFTGIATTLAVGSVSIFVFAQNLQGVPLALIGMSYSIATFPFLAKVFAAGDRQSFQNQLSSAARHIIFWSVPAAALFIVLRAHIVRAILGSGAFSWDDTRLTAACLAIFAGSLVFQGLQLLLIRAHYAAGRNKDVLYATVLGAIVSVAAAYVGLYIFGNFEKFKFFMEHLLRIDDLRGTAIIMLPSAFLLGSIFTTIILFYTIRKNVGVRLTGAGETAFHSFAAASVAGFIAYQFLDYFGTAVGTESFIKIFSSAFISGSFGIAAGAILLYMLGNKEFKEIFHAIKTRFTKEEIVAPQEM